MHKAKSSSPVTYLAEGSCTSRSITGMCVSLYLVAKIRQSKDNIAPPKNKTETPTTLTFYTIFSDVFHHTFMVKFCNKIMVLCLFQMGVSVFKNITRYRPRANTVNIIDSKIQCPHFSASVKLRWDRFKYLYNLLMYLNSDSSVRYKLYYITLNK